MGHKSPRCPMCRAPLLCWIIIPIALVSSLSRSRSVSSLCCFRPPLNSFASVRLPYHSHSNRRHVQWSPYKLPRGIVGITCCPTHHNLWCGCFEVQPPERVIIARHFTRMCKTIISPGTYDYQCRIWAAFEHDLPLCPCLEWVRSHLERHWSHTDIRFTSLGIGIHVVINGSGVASEESIQISSLDRVSNLF